MSSIGKLFFSEKNTTMKNGMHKSLDTKEINGVLCLMSEQREERTVINGYFKKHGKWNLKLNLQKI